MGPVGVFNMMPEYYSCRSGGSRRVGLGFWIFRFSLAKRQRSGRGTGNRLTQEK